MLLHTDFITCFLVLPLELFQYIWNISKMIKLSKSNKYRVTQKTFSGLKMRKKIIAVSGSKVLLILKWGF